MLGYTEYDTPGIQRVWALMNPPIYTNVPIVRLPAVNSPPPANDVADLMRQMIELQKEQLAALRGLLAYQDSVSRWRAFLNRWQIEFPTIGQTCKEVLPQVERAYLILLKELTDKLQEEQDTLEEDFALSEFLDRYGMRLSQLGTVMSHVAPLADAAPPPAPPPPPADHTSGS
jgi:hypothetical protein